MKKVVSFIVFSTALISSAFCQTDPREPFLGYYRCSGYSLGVPSGKRKEIKDTILIFKKDPADSSKIVRKWASENNATDKSLYFFPSDSSFDESVINPNHYDRGYFYTEDSVYNFHSIPGARVGDYFTEYHVWGKWFAKLGGVGIENNYGELLNIYPNPTSDIIKLSGNVPDSYVLYSLTGQLVQSGAIENNSISVAHLPKGVYLLHLEIKGVSVVKKVMKE